MVCILEKPVYADTLPEVYVDGIKLKTNRMMKDNHLMVPLKEYFKDTGAKVKWDPKNNSFEVTYNNKVVTIVIGQMHAYVNGQQKLMDEPIYISNGTAYISLEFITESFDSIVQRDKEKNIVSIINSKESYDVVVIGTDPEGITAAIAAAREGQKTLLIDSRNRVGGLFTLGELNTLDMSRNPDGWVLTRGLFEEFFNKIERRTSFDIDQAEAVFNKMIKKEKNITLKLSETEIKPVIKNNKIVAITSKNNKGKQVAYRGKSFIDSTQNGDIAYLSGEQFTVGQEDYRHIPETMGVTLVFELKGVNWNKVKKAIRHDKKSHTGYDDYSAWGFSEMYNYKPLQKDIKMRGLNIGLQDDGSILINALQILNVDGTNKKELKQARERAEKELPYIVKYMNKHLKGFEHAVLSKTASELYVRETRHLIGQYRLNVNDVLENRDFQDKIALGSYAIDVQTSATQSGFVVGDPYQYSVPFRAIVPKKITNLLVASRSASYDSLAHGSARVVPVGMVVGEAAGIASAYANENNIDFITMAQQPNFEHIKQIQKIMNTKGAYLTDIPCYVNSVTNDWSYEGIKLLRKYGLLSGSYINDYAQNSLAKKRDLNQLMNSLNVRAQLQKVIVYPFESTTEELTKEDIVNFLEKNDVMLSELSQTTQYHINEPGGITRGTVYMVIFELIKKSIL